MGENQDPIQSWRTQLEGPLGPQLGVRVSDLGAAPKQHDQRTEAQLVLEPAHRSLGLQPDAHGHVSVFAYKRDIFGWSREGAKSWRLESVAQTPLPTLLENPLEWLFEYSTRTSTKESPSGREASPPRPLENERQRALEQLFRDLKRVYEDARKTALLYLCVLIFSITLEVSAGLALAFYFGDMFSLEVSATLAASIAAGFCMVVATPILPHWRKERARRDRAENYLADLRRQANNEQLIKNAYEFTRGAAQ